MPEKLIDVKIDGYVGTVTMCHQKRRNVINQALIDRDGRRVCRFQPGKNAGGHPPRRARVKVWSAGHDVNELPDSGCDPLAYNDPLTTLLRLIQQCPMPVLAMVEGEYGEERSISP